MIQVDNMLSLPEIIIINHTPSLATNTIIRLKENMTGKVRRAIKGAKCAAARCAAGWQHSHQQREQSPFLDVALREFSARLVYEYLP
jgi:hypothetical protein